MFSRRFVFSTTSSEIEDEISKLNSGKSTGPFSISVDILKRLKTFLSKPLEIIFNTSFSFGIVPTDIKWANIIPVFKSGSQTCLSNYRLISLLSVLHKLLGSMYSYFSKNLPNYFNNYFKLNDTFNSQNTRTAPNMFSDYKRKNYGKFSLKFRELKFGTNYLKT